MNLFEFASQYGMAVIVVVQFLYFIALLVLSTKFAPKSVEEEIEIINEKIIRLQVSVDNFPSKEDFYQLEKNITELKGDLRAVDKVLNGFDHLIRRTEKQLTLVDQHLRSQSTGGIHHG